MRYLSVLSLLFITILFSDCHLIRGFKYRKFDPKDATKIAGLPIDKGENAVFHYKKPDKPLNEAWVKYLDTALENSKTYAFVVIRNDSLLYENYLGDWKEDQLFPSYSVAKSFTSALVGIALNEGKIKSLNDPITDYLPELLTSDERFKLVTIQHILDMRSGIINIHQIYSKTWKFYSNFTINY